MAPVPQFVNSRSESGQAEGNAILTEYLGEHPHAAEAEALSTVNAALPAAARGADLSFMPRGSHPMAPNKPEDLGDSVSKSCTDTINQATLVDEPPCPNAGTDADNAGKPKLSPCHEKAFNSYNWAVSENAALDTDQEAYDWLKENYEEELPDYENWGRYLRYARKALGKNKYTPRRGREQGRSIVRLDKI
jgi:hypothetical protein